MRPVSSAAGLLLAACIASLSLTARAAPAPRRAASTPALPFVRNDGQTHRAAAFHTRLRGGALFVTRTGELVYALDGAPGAGGVTLVERPGAPALGRARGERRTATQVSFFRGEDPRRWRSRVPTFEAVSLGEVAPGVTLTLEARGGEVEKVFRVAPGADPRRIWVEVRGARLIAPDAEGRLAVTTALGTIRFSRPVAYQADAAGLREVAVSYRAGRGGYGFDVGDHDRSRPLVIDPLLTTFLGGAGLEYGYALAVRNTAGGPLLYVAGSTTSFAEFPGAAEPGGVTAGGGGGGSSDAFVARLDHDLSQAAVAILGGNGEDAAYDVAVHPVTGQVFVTGWTEGGFPAPGSAAGRGVGKDGFVARLGGDLATLEAARYVGGNGTDAAYAIAIEQRTDGAGDLVYVAGSTRSTDLPATAGTVRPTKTHGSDGDGFAAVFDTTLTLQHATYLGGCGEEAARGVAVAADHRVWVTGSASYDPFVIPSVAGCFPWIADQASFAGGYDAFVVRVPDRLMDDGSTVARYVGGPGIDRAFSAVIDPPTGEVVVAGYVTCGVSGQGGVAGFPFPPLPYVPAQSECAGQHDGYLVRLDPGDLSPTGATLLGGSEIDWLTAVVVDDLGLHALGRTSSPDLPSTAGALVPRRGGRNDDALVAWMADDLTSIRQATYLGGAGNDESMGRGLAVVHDPHSGAIQVLAVGDTESEDLPGVPDVDGVVQRFSGGSVDAFVARMPASLRAPPEPDLDAEPGRFVFGNHSVTATAAWPLELRNLGAEPLHFTADAWVEGAPTFDVQAIGSCASLAPTVAAGGSCTMYVSYAPRARGRFTGLLHLQTDDPDEPHVVIPLSGVSEPDVDLLPKRTGGQAGWTYPEVALGTSFDFTFAIRNLGTSPLLVTSVTHVGIAPTPSSAFAPRFGSAPLCPEPTPAAPFALGPGQSCGVVLRFLPQAQGAAEGLVVVWSDDPDEAPVTAQLAGTCIDPSLAPSLATAPRMDFGEVAVGEWETRVVLVANRGQGANLQVRSFTLSDPARFSVDPWGGDAPCATRTLGVPPLVTAGDQGSYCTAILTFAPSAADPAVSETLVIASNDPTDPEFSVELVGRAIGDGPPPPVPPPAGGGGGGGGCGCGLGGGTSAAAWLAALALALQAGRRRVRVPLGSR